MSPIEGEVSPPVVPARVADARFPLALALGAVLSLFLLTVAWRNQITSDDIFFLDVARNLLDHGRLSMSIWGNPLGHESFLASYPPVVPALVVSDLWLMRLTGSPVFIRSTGALLLLVSGLLFWRSLEFLDGRWLRALITAGVLVDPVMVTSSLSLRPEALLIPLMLGLYVAGRQLLARPRTRTCLALMLLAPLAALTHWQFATTLFVLALVFGWLVAQRRLDMRWLAGYVTVTAVTYAGYAYVVTSSPVRLAAFRAQMSVVAGTAGPLRKLAFFGGNVLVANMVGSAFAVAVVVVLLLLADQAIRAASNRAPAGLEEALYDLAFLGAALTPSMYLDYVGPRLFPLLLVVALILVRFAHRTPPGKFAAVMLGAAAANYVGYATMQYSYGRASGLGPLSGSSLAWLAVATMIAAWTWWGKRPRALRTGAVVLVAAVSTAADAAVARATVFDSSAANVHAVARHLDPRLLAGKSVLCDITVHYLPLEKAAPSARIYSTFPLLYFQQPGAFMDSMKPDVILTSSFMYVNFKRNPGDARPLLDTLRLAFALRDTFTVGGVKTWVYVRR